MRARAGDSTPRLSRGPFSRPLRVRDVPDDGLATTIEASPGECTAIAAETGLPALGALAVRYHIAPRAGGRIDVTGDLDAKVTQICVVSLEPFDSEITQSIAMAFAPEAPLEREAIREDRKRGTDRVAAAPVMITDDQQDPPDPIVDDRIDLGAIALEFLVLALEPYPKKPGVHFNDVIIGENDEPQPSAFAALERLKDRS